jgi:hypothetical protein
VQISVSIVGPPISIPDKEIANRVTINYPLNTAGMNCLEHAMRLQREGENKGAPVVLLANVFMTFDRKETLWINMPYTGSKIIGERAWANWITDPGLVDIITGWF